MEEHNGGGLGNVIVGLGLVLLGLMFLLGQYLHIDLLGLAWPLFILVPGLCFFAGMLLGERRVGGLAIPGSLLTITGLLLFYQNLLNHFESWAYVWALVFPTGIGVGLMIKGLWEGRAKVVRDGWVWTQVGLIIFVCAGAFFELIIGISDSGLVRALWAMVLMAFGAILVLRPLLGPRPHAYIEHVTGMAQGDAQPSTLPGVGAEADERGS
ncbi:MAG: hypothetical protein ACUVX9_07560 [Anaerolineae bacterium]